MKKNVASQVIGAQMITASDGSAFTGTVTVVVTIDGGTQSASGGTGPTHEGNGFHSYLPTQAETNGDHIAFTFTGTGAIPVTVQVYTDFPQTGDSYTRLGAPAGASVSADIAAVPTVSEVQAGLGIHETTIATLTSATVFTLTAGSADDNAYRGFGAYARDSATSTQIELGIVASYVGSSLEITLESDPGIYVKAIGDTIILLPGKLTDVVDANVTQLGGSTQSATDLKDFADSGYDPATNKVQGVVLVDTTTTNTDMRGTDSALTDKTGFSLSAAGIDAIFDEVYEGTTTFRQYLRLAASALWGKLSGGGTTAIAIRDEGDTKNRISATVDADGNRSAVTLDKT